MLLGLDIRRLQVSPRTSQVPHRLLIRSRYPYQVSSRARCRRTGVTASQRSVIIRSPGLVCAIKTSRRSGSSVDPDPLPGLPRARDIGAGWAEVVDAGFNVS